MVSVSEWRCRVQVRLRVCTSRAHINAHVYVRVSALSRSLCFRLSEASTSSSLTSGQHHRFKMAPKPPSLKIKMSHVFSPSQFYRSPPLLPSRRGGLTRSPHLPLPSCPHPSPRKSQRQNLKLTTSISLYDFIGDLLRV